MDATTRSTPSAARRADLRSACYIGACVAMILTAGCANHAGALGPVPSGNAVGYVDVDKVVQAHPLHSELQALEDQIASLNAQAVSAPQAATPSQRIAQADLERELQTAQAQFEDELGRKRAFYQRQAQDLMANLQAPGTQPQPGGVLGGMQQQFQNQMKDLQASGARTLDAFRTALFKADTEHLKSVQQLLAADVRSKIRAKESQLSAKETAYQVQLAQQDQDQRLNLKTKLENLSLSPQDRSLYAAQLQDIETREELLTNQLKTKDNAELAAYESAQQKDASDRFNTERTSTQKKTQAKLAVRENELQSEFRAQAATLGGKFNDQLNAANKALVNDPKVASKIQDIQDSTQAKYQADAAQSLAAYQQTRKMLVAKYSAIAHMQFQDDQAIQSEIDSIAAQRRDLYARIMDQVQDQVRTIAQARGYGIVFDSVAGAGSAVDLTDLVSKAVAALPAASASPSSGG